MNKLLSHKTLAYTFPSIFFTFIFVGMSTISVCFYNLDVHFLSLNRESRHTQMLKECAAVPNTNVYIHQHIPYFYDRRWDILNLFLTLNP